jgi:hypothetical protein
MIDDLINKDIEFVNKPINKVNSNYLEMLDTLLHYCAYKNNKEMINYLLSKNANTNMRNSVISFRKYILIFFIREGYCLLIFVKTKRLKFC